MLVYHTKRKRFVRGIFAQLLALTLVAQTVAAPVAGIVNAKKAKAATPALQSLSIVFAATTTNYNGIHGLAYHQGQNKLLASVNTPTGLPRNFETLAGDGTHAAFSNLGGVAGEVRLATARDDGTGLSLAGFAPGETFTTTGANGVIARLSANGATVSNPWATLPNEGTAITGLAFDRTGLYGGHLLAATAGGRVWRVNATGQATLVATLAAALAGVVSLPNDPDRYGPWAGRILTGAPSQSAVHAINAAGQSVSQNVSVNPAELLVVPPQENLYGTDPVSQKIWGAADDAFAGLTGEILVAQTAPGKLGRLRWNGSAFEFNQLAEVPSWRQLTFAPAGLAPIADAGRYYGQIALVRKGLTLNAGRIEGAVWQLNPEAVQLNGNATITSDLLVPGTPNIVRNGNQTDLDGILDGGGNANPTNYTITMEGRAAVRYIVRRVDPTTMPTVAAVPDTTNTRDITLNNSNQNPGSWATVRHLSISGSIAPVALPAGTYGNLTMSGNNTLVLGTTGQTAPQTYNLQSLAVSGSCEVRVLSPVVLNVKNDVSFQGGTYGSVTNAKDLRLNISNGNLTQGGNSVTYGIVRAPLGTVTLNGNARLRGTVSCDRLFVNGNSVLQISESDVTPPSTNRPPVVNAGDDQSIAAEGTGAALQGVVSDDGLPTGATLSYQWSKLSGPGNVTFSAPTSLTTNAAFDQSGVYVLRLTASDTQLIGNDEVTITVTQTNQAPAANAGPDQTISLPTNSVSLTGTASDDGLPTGVPLAYTWTKISGPGTVAFSAANALTTTATFSTNGTYILRLTVSDSLLSGTDDVTVFVNRAPQVNAGADQTITLPNDTVALAGTAVDDGLPPSAVLAHQWTKISGPGTVTFSAANALTTNATFSAAGTYVLRLTTSDGLASGSDDVQIIVIANNQPPTVNAGADQTINHPANSVSLSGTATDDGLPTGAALTYTWTRASGPGTVTFSTPNALATTATFSAPGVYTLRLTVSDTSLSNSDEINITINQAPTVNAGADQIISLPTTSTSLTGTATDADNLPAGAVLTTTWTKVSGPGTVTFSAANALNTTATFSQGGVYTLRLTASDTLASASDDVIVTVNTAPTVNAGAAQLITYQLTGATTANLAGTASDPDGLPQGSSLSVSWNKQSGPGAVTFANANALTTTATFSAPGVYVLRLTATDGAASATSDVTITVNAAPTVNAGADQLVNLPLTSANLTGLANDDGLPIAPLSTIWTQVSGPGTVTFANANSPVTTASFSTNGVYVLRLTASDSAVMTSDDVVITINVAPVVNAGADQNITTLSGVVTLAGTATDDGLPVTPGLSVTWSQVSGPGATTFANANSAATTATFNQYGTYVLRLTATDGALTITDEVTVTVGIIRPLFVDAGPNQYVGWDGAGAIAFLSGTVLDDSLPPRPFTLKWTKVSGPGNVVFSRDDIRFPNASFDAQGTYVLRLTATAGAEQAADEVTIYASLDNQPPFIQPIAETLIHWPTNQVSLSAVVTDDGIPAGATLTTSWRLVRGPGTATFTPATGTTTTVMFSAPGRYWLRIAASDTLAIGERDLFVLVNQLPQVEAGPEQTISLPNTATMQATVTDDGLPYGLLEHYWTQVGGPATASFSNSQALNATVTFPAPGVYVFELTGNDYSGVALVKDRVAIHVQPQNRAPIVDAGLDRAITLPTNSLTLAGTVTDDGYPIGTSPTLSWSQVSGPGTATFGNAASAVTTATFSTTGTYTLRLTANDSALQASDDLVVTVSATNQAPLVNAGADQNVQSPANTVSLFGAVTDDGLPANQPLTATWTKLSGPGEVTFGNANAAGTTAVFGAQGTYVLRLTASDGQFTASDDVTVTVACAANTAKLDVMLLIDRSGSYVGQPLLDAKAAAKAFVDRLQLSTNDQVGVVSFGDPATTDQTLTRDANLVKTKIDALVAGAARISARRSTPRVLN
jgi:hypothetical protein